MGGVAKLELADAQLVAEDLIEMLAPFCERIEVAGSVRRRKPLVGDIELLCIPRTDQREAMRLFDEGEIIEVDLLSEEVEKLLHEGVFTYRLNAIGRKIGVAEWNKALIFGGHAVDLFSTTVPGWGVSMAIRTGPADLNKAVVTRRSMGGLCPDWLEVHVSAEHAQVNGRGDKHDVIATPTEEAFFAALGLEYLTPPARENRLPRMLPTPVPSR